jgi:predicted aspartyl protease
MAVGGLEGSITGSDSLIDARSIERASLAGIMRNGGYDGQARWTSDESGLVDLVESEAAQREWTTGGFLWSGAYLRLFATEQESLRSEVRAGRNFQVVSLTPPGGEPVELWVDAQTHLITRVVLPLQKSTTEWSDYRSVQGLLLPHRFQSNSESGDEQLVEISAYRLHTTLDPATFARPESRARDIHLAKPSELPALIDKGMVVVRVAIGEAAPLPFLLDTGANVNVLTPVTAAALNIKTQGSLNASGVGTDTVSAALAKVPRMTIGAAVLDNQTFIVLPIPPLFVNSRNGREAVAGALGYDFFRRLIVGIDYAAARVSLAPLRSCGVAAAHTAQLFLDEERIPQVEATLDGVTGLWTIDTGNTGATSVTSAMAERLGIPPDAGAYYVTNGGIGGTLPVRALRHERFELAGLRVNGSVFHVTAQRKGAHSSPRFAGSLGYSQLRHFALTFDYECRRLSLTTAPFTAPNTDDRVGVIWNMRNVQQAEVLHVVPGSPAAQAGIREKDVMIELDGKPAGVLEADRWGAVRSAAVGTQLLLVMQRGDQRYGTVITLQEFIPCAPERG